MISSKDELLDIVDKDDEVIGQCLKSEIYEKGLKNFRVVNAFLLNSEGKLWIMRRTNKPALFPLSLDMSVGGHVKAGESYIQALERELKEELNLDLRSCNWKRLGI